MTKKIILLFGIFFFLIGVWGFTVSKDIVMDSQDLKGLTFFHISKEKNIIYTTAEKSFKYSKGKKIPLEFTVIDKFEQKNKNYYIAEFDGMVGVFSNNLTPIIAMNYDKIEKFGEKFILGMRDKENYLIDMESYKMLGPFEVITSFNNGELFRGRNGEEITYLDKNGKEILELKNKEIFFVRDEKVVIKENKVFSLYDIEKNIYLIKKYDEIYFGGENILVKKYDKYYLNGENLNIKYIYPTTNDVIIYDLQNGFSFINLRDKYISKEVYDEISHNYDKYMIVGKKGKYGIMNKYKNIKVLYDYDYVTHVGLNSFAVGVDTSRFMALVVGDKKITNMEYSEFMELNPHRFLAFKDKDFYLINSKGKILKKDMRKNIFFYDENSFIVKDDDKVYVYNLEE